MINYHNQRLIREQFDKTIFTLSAYKLTFQRTGETLLNVDFIDNPSYYFKLMYTNDEYYVSYRPGKIMDIQTTKLYNFDEIFSEIGEWAGYIRKELIVKNPIYDEFDQLKDAVNRTIDEKFKDINELFTTDEIMEIITNMDLLKEKLNELEANHKLTTEQVTALKKKIESLTRDAEELPKKVWYRTAYNGILQFGKSLISSKEGQNLIIEATRKMAQLPPGQ